jgi:DNA-binding transcriptional LysR family regulator
MDAAMRYFYETATCGSMRAASDKLGVAVSSISRQIAQLEHQFGILLFERNRRTIKLTEAGLLVFEYHRNSNAKRDMLTEQIAALRGSRSGKVSIAVGEGFLSSVFLGVVDAFQATHPEVEIVITVEPTTDAVRHVIDDEVHFAFVLQCPPEPKIRLRATVAQPLLVVCSPDHPLASLESVTLKELAQHELALPPPVTRIRQLLAAAEVKRDIWLAPRITSSSIYSLRILAKAGRLATILPEVSILAELAEGSLTAVRIAEPELETAEMSIISRVGRQLNGAPAKFLPLLETKLVSYR